MEAGFVEVMVWQLPEPLSGSTHSLKYRLACVVANECVLRYDNEAGKGDHRTWAPKRCPKCSCPSTNCSTTSWLMWPHGRGIDMGAVTSLS